MITNLKNPIETELGKQLAHTHPQLPKAMLGLRETAQLQFENFGLPHRRMERWKYTDLRTAMKSVLTPANIDVKPADIAIEKPFEDMIQLVVLDGQYVPKLSSARPNGVSVLTLEQAIASDLKEQVDAAFAHKDLQNESLVALNTALKTAVLVLHVQAGTKIVQPINLHSVFTQNAAYYTHVIAIIEDGAQVELVETEQYAASAQRNHIFQVDVGQGAHFTHVVIHEHEVLNLRSSTASIAARAVYNQHSFTVASALTRQSLWVDVNGDHAELHLSGVQLVEGNEHQDITLHINHNAPHTISTERFRSVVRGEGRAVFQGKIFVAPAAQKTDAKMRANGLLLNEGAEFYAKPELEIYADDVLCAHGATSGAIDDELMFYLQARGIPEDVAKALLVQAFVGDVVEDIADEAVRDALMARVEKWLV